LKANTTLITFLDVAIDALKTESAMVADLSASSAFVNNTLLQGKREKF
jgi:hypothetical protein